MPIVLRDRRAAKTLDAEGASFAYIEAGGDEQLLAVRSRLSPGADADRSLVDAEIDLIAGHVLSWSGIEQADGTAAEWPESGAAAAGDFPRPSAAALKLRRELARVLPLSVLLRLMSAIQAPAKDGRESGKG